MLNMIKKLVSTTLACGAITVSIVSCEAPDMPQTTLLESSKSAQIASSVNVVEIKQVTPEEILDMLNKGELAPSDDFTTAANGTLSVSGTTPNFTSYLHAYNLLTGQVYRFVASGDFEAYLFKKINGVWVYDRVIDENFNSSIKGGDTNFTEVYVYGFQNAWRQNNFSLKLEKVASATPSEKTLSGVAHQSQYAMNGTLNGKTFTYDQRNASCGPMAVAMNMNYLNRRKTTSLNNEAIYLYGKFGTTTANGSERYTVASQTSSIYGVNAQNLTSDLWNTLVTEINAGRPAVFRSKSIPGFSAGHYVTVIGYKTSPNRLVVNDPASSSGAGRIYDWATISRTDASVIRIR